MKKTAFILCLTLALAGCRKDDVPKPEQEKEPVIGVNGKMTGAIRGVPEGVVFDRISVEICGFDWQTVTTVEAPFQNDTAMLILPASFAEADLQLVDRGNNGRRMEGHWPSIADDPAAGVATLREEIIAWSGDRKVGRIYLTDWSGDPAVSTVGKMFIGWQYADRPFVLNGFTGRNNGFTFPNCAFAQGWNAYAKINTSTRNIRVSTDIPVDNTLGWRFEAWP